MTPTNLQSGPVMALPLRPAHRPSVARPASMQPAACIDIANSLQRGDTVTPPGDLGAGKTTSARALIRYLAGDALVEVPSPTFTLMQTYDLPQFTLVHVDLYRLSGSGDLAELGLDDLPEGAVVLIEWPDRAVGILPPDRLDVALTLAPKLKLEFRHARVTGYGSFGPRVDRMASARQFIAESGYSEALRVRMQGDASTRSYERLALGDKHVILMNMPRRPDGPPIRSGKPYSAVAHLADSVVPFVAMANGLRQYGFSAPIIHHADLDHGLLILEDLGDERVVSGDPPAPIQERYETAVDVLLELHEQQLPDTLPVAPHVEYRIPSYDMNAFRSKPNPGGLVPAAARRGGSWIPNADRSGRSASCHPAIESPPTWVLRDLFPNLLWLRSAAENARLGILDFQDAVMGRPPTISPRCCRTHAWTCPNRLRSRCSAVTRGRSRTDPELRCGAIHQALRDASAAQRASKILGIFARLDIRMASCNICVTRHGYGAAAARSAILPWSRSMLGILPTSHR
jgi:tRNA threonylcarbamoyl adenosine modification protein YjeE